jgi:hypothetical protein
MDTPRGETGVRQLTDDIARAALPPTDKQRLLWVADNVEGFFGDLASEVIGADAKRLAREDAQCIREIAEKLR